MRAGLGIRPELFGPVVQHKPEFGFLEAHSENYFGTSIARAKLLELRQDYPISLHGVGLSLGRADALDLNHLKELKQLADEVEPFLVSDHLAWSAYAHQHVPDLLPLPLTEQALNIVCSHVEQMQDALGRQILVENPSNYLVFDQLQIPEPEFLNELSRRTGCLLLVDVNNIHVSATNVKRDAIAYIDALDSNAIGEYHLAGYTEVDGDRGGVEERVLIDTHNQTVYPPVWDLFEHTLKVHGARPSLIEWDSDFPEFDVLLGECAKADKMLGGIEASAEVTIDTRAKPLTVKSKSPIVPQNDGLPLNNEQADFIEQLLALENNQLATAEAAYSHRFWIYQNNVFAALQEYLADVFPATKGVVGKDFFKQMAQVYIQKSPPKQGNIHSYGHHFADIVEYFEGLSDLVYLADLIRYEWALHSAYYAADEQPLDVSNIDQNDLLSMPVSLSENLHLIESNYPVLSIHAQSLPDYEGDIGVSLDQSQDKILVCRPGFEVITRLINGDQLELVKILQKSENLLQGIEALQGSISADSLSQALGLIFELSLLRPKTTVQAA